MARKLKLTWLAGAAGRSGRWRKKYKGKPYYYPGGRGKSDREAYDAALDAWNAEKLKIDREAPRRFQQDHATAIEQWEKVLAWCNRHGDPEHAEIAAKKLESLRKRLASRVLRPLDPDDWFESLLDNPLKTAFADIAESLDKFANIPAREETSRPRVLFKPTAALWDVDPWVIKKEIWRDRLAVQDRNAAPDDESLGSYIKLFIAQKESQAGAGEVSMGRVYALRLHLDHFRDWLGKDTPVKEIDGASLIRYHAHLLEKLASGEWSRRTGGHYLASVKGFVRWLWQTEAIPVLPRIIDGKSTVLKITKPLPKVVTFTMDEIKSLLADASDRTKLYMLLMLNCGMTQKDISDLLVSEVDWEEGRIIRRRSKTTNEKNVPVVNYKLWGETFRLLLQERAADSKERVLLNANGSPLWTEVITKDGKYMKTDNVKSAFERLRTVKKTKEPLKAKNKTSAKEAKKAVKATIDKPLKSLKKTSATLLRDNEKFSALASLFLGHAPQSMSDRHYTQVPQTLLDQAVEWLASEYGLA